MDTESKQQVPYSREDVFWWGHASLEKRLAHVFGYTPGEYHVSTQDLESNASFVNYVRHHRLTHLHSGDTFDVVEKSIRKVLFISSLEARFYRERGALAGSVHFQHPDCLGVIETPWESLIFTRFVHGQAPRMARIAPQIAQGIAEIEERSNRHVQTNSWRQGYRFWEMDFFRPWYLLRWRFNFVRYLPSLDALPAGDARFQGLAARLRKLQPALRRAQAQANQTPRCFCHMDYLAKNFFVSPAGLQMIDWSEVKIGRVGFDAGAYLSAMFRQRDMVQFAKVRGEFLSRYVEALDQRFDAPSALRNADYFFLQNALWHFLRPKTIAEYQQRGKLDLLREKYEYLLTLSL
ncbi:Phosphotransferase enzyme family protein [Pseudomonas sp. ok272]|uniref:phosphotransferase family protein n=1 Tax=unclassified Pseudomonas TaxID=196821 RepID=UPI0008CF8E0B|nr:MULTISPECIES: phosphotransferase [unclassified Pseudomonas]SEM99283.1 Phosphotransferase enzyme family protein [Pseudomonas sp. ok272]SFM89933.1 Phosphotransferase enzyme family protein [Pseudomonas sp. ok602]